MSNLCSFPSVSHGCAGFVVSNGFNQLVSDNFGSGSCPSGCCLKSEVTILSRDCALNFVFHEIVFSFATNISAV